MDENPFDNLGQTEMRATMGSLAEACWTLYSEAKAAGFDNEQAMHLTIEWMRNIVRGASES